MADQTLSPSGSPAKTEIPAKAGSGKRAVLYTRISNGDQHAERYAWGLETNRYRLLRQWIAKRTMLGGGNGARKQV